MIISRIQNLTIHGFISWSCYHDIYHFLHKFKTNLEFFSKISTSTSSENILIVFKYFRLPLRLCGHFYHQQENTDLLVGRDSFWCLSISVSLPYYSLCCSLILSAAEPQFPLRVKRKPRSRFMFVLEEEEEENLFLRCDISCLVSKVTNKTHWCSSQQVVLYSVFCLYQPTLQQRAT